MTDIGQLGGALNEALATLGDEFRSIWLPIQIGIILGVAAVSALAGKMIRSRVKPTDLTMGWPAFLRLLVRLLLQNIGIIIFVLLLTVARVGLMSATWPSHSYLLGVAAKLATAWFFIALVAGLIRNPVAYRLVAVFAWTIAALSILGLLRPTMAALDSVGLAIGGLRVTPLLVIKTSVLMVLTLWLANATSDFIERRLQRSADLTPSIQVLIGKIARLMLITFAILIALSTAGIDFTALAFFSGAVGLGLGFGLQKVVSNLVSGIILLADKSIKPGDIISVGEHFGRVGIMGARYTSVDTRDGREYLIPNEDFITQRVANWTYSSDFVRLSATFNTTYDSNPRKAQEAAIAAALSVERVVAKPAPACMLTAFGASSIGFELWFWVKDPSLGIANVKSDVLMALWDTLEREGVKIPKPGPSRVIYERAREDEPDPPKDDTDPPAPAASKSPFD